MVYKYLSDQEEKTITIYNHFNRTIVFFRYMLWTFLCPFFFLFIFFTKTVVVFAAVRLALTSVVCAEMLH